MTSTQTTTGHHYEPQWLPGARPTRIEVPPRAPDTLETVKHDRDACRAACKEALDLLHSGELLLAGRLLERVLKGYK
jgi:hypothetical protein